MISWIKRCLFSSIRRQLIVGIALVHAVLMTFFVFDLVGKQRDFLHQQGVEQTLSLARTLAANSTSWVLANDFIGMEEVISSLAHYPELRYAMLLSPAGKVLSHNEVDKVGQYTSDALSRRLLSAAPSPLVLLETATAVDAAAPILQNNKVAGWARISLNVVDLSNPFKL